MLALYNGIRDDDLGLDALKDLTHALMLALLAYHLVGCPKVPLLKQPFATKIFSYASKFLLQDHLHLLQIL